MRSLLACAALIGAGSTACEWFELADPVGHEAGAVFSVHADSTAVHADRRSRVAVHVILKRTDLYGAEASFVASIGAFLSADPKSPTVTKARSVDSTATVIFLVPAAPGTAIIQATVGSLQQVLELPILPLPESFFSVAVNATEATLDADGVSRTVVTAALGAAHEDGTDVLFLAEGGRMIEGDAAGTRAIRKARAGLATVTFVAGVTPGIGRVSASAAERTGRTELDLRPALPSDIVLTTDKLAIEADGVDAATITATLSRPKGSVSRGLLVDFMVSNAAGASLAQLGGVVMVTDQPVRHRLISLVPGELTVRARVRGSEIASESVRVIAR